MGLLTLPFRLPVMPLKAFIRLAELLQEEAERELHDPARVRRQLEEADQARGRGEMSDEDVSQAEEEAVTSLTTTGDEGDA